ncbi:hypothetical protein C8R48DRAFT_94739 [Suillus tomentosus]|nr:hypothetical protein C8R48DRAFT_94739 [Suillus tomentosus]
MLRRPLLKHPLCSLHNCRPSSQRSTICTHLKMKTGTQTSSLLRTRARQGTQSCLLGRMGRKKAGSRLTSNSTILHTNPPWMNQLQVIMVSKTMISLRKRKRKLDRRRRHYRNPPPLQNQNRNLRQKAEGKRFSRKVKMRTTVTTLVRGHLTQVGICPRTKTRDDNPKGSEIIVTPEITKIPPKTIAPPPKQTLSVTFQSRAFSIKPRSTPMSELIRCVNS